MHRRLRHISVRGFGPKLANGLSRYTERVGHFLSRGLGLTVLGFASACLRLPASGHDWHHCHGSIREGRAAHLRAEVDHPQTGGQLPRSGGGQLRCKRVVKSARNRANMATSHPSRRGLRLFLAACSPLTDRAIRGVDVRPLRAHLDLSAYCPLARAPSVRAGDEACSGSRPSAFAVSATVSVPRAIRRRTASLLNDSGLNLLCCIGGTPTRIAPFGVSTKAG